MILTLDECPISGQFVFYEDEKDKFEGITSFHKAYIINDEVIKSDIIGDLIYEYEEEKSFRNTQLKEDYTNVMSLIIANIIRAITSKKEYIRISLNSSNFKGKNRIIKYEPIKTTYTVYNNLITWLAQNDYINLYKGTNNPTLKLASLIEPIDKITIWLKDYNINYTSVKIHQDYEYVKVRNKEKQPIVFEDTEETIFRKNLMNKYNALLNNSQITIDNKMVSYPIGIESTYTEEIGKNGRLSKGEWMNCKSELRSTIQINGSNTIELDFGNSVIRLAAHLNKVDVKPEVDLYKINNENRTFVKRIVTRIPNFNSSTIKDLANKATNSIYKESGEGVAYAIARGKKDTHNLSIDEFNEIKDSIEKDIKDNENNFEYLKKRYGFPWSKEELKKDIRLILDELYKIAGPYLLNKRGLELMYYESQVCCKIIEKFLNLDKVVLTIHDSFVVKEEDKALLEKIMVESYKEVTGGYLPKITS